LPPPLGGSEVVRRDRDHRERSCTNAPPPFAARSACSRLVEAFHFQQEVRDRQRDLRIAGV
jgi:hypothetical protein